MSAPEAVPRIGTQYPVIQSAEVPWTLSTESVLHNVTPDGRPMHSFEKVDGVWVCACGERRDRFGAVL